MLENVRLEIHLLSHEDGAIEALLCIDLGCVWRNLLLFRHFSYCKSALRVHSDRPFLSNKNKKNRVRKWDWIQSRFTYTVQFLFSSRGLNCTSIAFFIKSDVACVFISPISPGIRVHIYYQLKNRLYFEDVICTFSRVPRYFSLKLLSSLLTCSRELCAFYSHFDCLQRMIISLDIDCSSCNSYFSFVPRLSSSS